MDDSMAGLYSPFQSTLPGWGATWPLPSGCVFQPVFQSTLPGWGATTPAGCRRASTRYFNPRSPDGERPTAQRYHSIISGISIHAPRMGSDLRGEGCQTVFGRISIHAPRMGSDQLSGWLVRHSCRFQSTLPGWGATSRHHDTVGPMISIHAPRMGSDCPRPDPRMPSSRFQSTLPGWGATPLRLQGRILKTISIHAPRMGSDHITFHIMVGRLADFNPRSPDGERPGHYNLPTFGDNPFQSTLPGWGATYGTRYNTAYSLLFQSTLPGWGATFQKRAPRQMWWDFNPRSPDGERPNIVSYDPHTCIFQSTLPGWGATTTFRPPSRRGTNFNPRSPDGERRLRPLSVERMTDFNPRSPDGERPDGFGCSMGRYSISIHAPRMGSDYTSDQIVHCKFLFQSTLPGWGATPNPRPCS